MMRFKEFRQKKLEEKMLRSGSVVAFAGKAKQHGDAAEKDYTAAKRKVVPLKSEPNLDDKLNQLADLLAELLNGMIETRKQIGAISAQVTASTILEKTSQN